MVVERTTDSNAVRAFFAFPVNGEGVGSGLKAVLNSLTVVSASILGLGFFLE